MECFGFRFFIFLQTNCSGLFSLFWNCVGLKKRKDNLFGYYFLILSNYKCTTQQALNFDMHNLYNKNRKHLLDYDTSAFVCGLLRYCIDT